MADLKLRDLIVLQHVLQLVSRQAPHAVRILQAVFRDDLRVQLVELNEVGVAQTKVPKQFHSLQRLVLQQGQIGSFSPCSLAKDVQVMVVFAT